MYCPRYRHTARKSDVVARRNRSVVDLDLAFRFAWIYMYLRLLNAAPAELDVISSVLSSV